MGSTAQLPTALLFSFYFERCRSSAAAAVAAVDGCCFARASLSLPSVAFKCSFLAKACYNSSCCCCCNSPTRPVCSHSLLPAFWLVLFYSLFLPLVFPPESGRIFCRFWNTFVTSLTKLMCVVWSSTKASLMCCAVWWWWWWNGKVTFLKPSWCQFQLLVWISNNQSSVGSSTVWHWSTLHNTETDTVKSIFRCRSTITAAQSLDFDTRWTASTWFLINRPYLFPLFVPPTHHCWRYWSVTDCVSDRDLTIDTWHQYFGTTSIFDFPLGFATLFPFVAICQLNVGPSVLFSLTHLHAHLQALFTTVSVHSDL